MTRTAFWDSSALTVLFCRQAPSTRGRQLARTFSRQVVWWATPVEIASAVARLHRDGLVTKDDLQKNLTKLSLLQKSWVTIEPVDQIRETAQTLLLHHTLRAADSLQLAAALAWCKNKTRRRPFICFDDRLAQAAEATGFEVYHFEKIPQSTRKR